MMYHVIVDLGTSYQYNILQVRIAKFISAECDDVWV